MLVRASPCDPRPLRRGVTSWRSVTSYQQVDSTRTTPALPTRKCQPLGRLIYIGKKSLSRENNSFKSTWRSLRVSDPPDKERSAPGLETRTLPGNATRGRPRLEAGSGMTRGKEPAEEGGGAESERRRAVGSTSAGRDRYAASHGGNGPQPEPRPSPPPPVHMASHTAPRNVSLHPRSPGTLVTSRPTCVIHPGGGYTTRETIENRRACAFAFAGGEAGLLDR